MLRILALVATTIYVAIVTPDPIREHLERTTWDLPPAVYQHPERTTTTTVTPEPVRSVQITAPVIWADERRQPAPPTTLPTVFEKCPGLTHRPADRPRPSPNQPDSPRHPRRLRDRLG